VHLLSYVRISTNRRSHHIPSLSPVRVHQRRRSCPHRISRARCFLAGPGTEEAHLICLFPNSVLFRCMTCQPSGANLNRSKHGPTFSPGIFGATYICFHVRCEQADTTASSPYVTREV
ncbi:hypothetical protein B296_00049126, partial [Ensete ventricosum]